MVDNKSQSLEQRPRYRVKRPDMGDVIDRYGFRANVGIVLMHEDGRLFIGRRSGED
jgi:hypothetical protein